MEPMLQTITHARLRRSRPGHSARHLVVADGARSNVVPLYGRNGGPSIGVPPALDDPASAMALRGWLVQSLLLEAIARDALGDASAAEHALQRALSVAEHDRALLAYPPVRSSESLREPLTDSEMRVLRLLPTNLSKREIGNELCLSINTIKAHTKHLYAKLDVHTRRQAVERARELRLLSHSMRAAEPNPPRHQGGM